MHLGIVLGDQLFEKNKLVSDCDLLLMVESVEEAKRLLYHKFRLVYQFTLMREYRDFLSINNKVIYFELNQNQNFEDALIHINNTQPISKVSYYEPSDKFFGIMLYEVVNKIFNLSPNILLNPNFLTTPSQFNNYLQTKSIKGLRMDNFYQHQRGRLNLLLTKNQKPVGGKWSFDDENRKKLPKNVKIPTRITDYQSKHYHQVVTEVEKMFGQNPGYINPKSCWLATNHQQARGALENFLTTYFENFGVFEDAMTTTDPFVFHSVLSPLINHGLLNPDYILETITAFIYQKYNFDISIPEDSFNQIPENLPLNSLEGFLRQIIGWREWVKGLYDTQYSQEVRERNFFKSTKPLPNYFWELDYNHLELKKNLPLKFALEKLNNWSWNHHIERLMVIANWMTLNGYNPQECLKWFNAMYVDGFDWVMVPNVLGMGMFADGGVFATKPYVAGGNYIKKMSDYPNPSLWEKMWTDKFWQFLIKHRDYFSTNPRLAMLLKNKTSKDISESVN